MAEPITFYLVRHGESDCNVQAIANSYPEKEKFHLTGEGRKQIAQVATELKEKSIDAIFASPVLRTQETAAIISEAIGVPVVTDERLREMGFGIFDGKPMKQFWERYPDATMRLTPFPEDKMESIPEMRARLKSFLDDMTAQHSGKKIVVVSHGDPLEQFHGILSNESPGEAASGWYPEKGSAIEMKWPKDEKE